MSATRLILALSIQLKKLPPMEPKASEQMNWASTQQWDQQEQQCFGQQQKTQHTPKTEVCTYFTPASTCSPPHPEKIDSVNFEFHLEAFGASGCCQEQRDLRHSGNKGASLQRTLQQIHRRHHCAQCV